MEETGIRNVMADKDPQSTPGPNSLEEEKHVKDCRSDGNNSEGRGCTALLSTTTGSDDVKAQREPQCIKETAGCTALLSTTTGSDVVKAQSEPQCIQETAGCTALLSTTTGSDVVKAQKEPQCIQETAGGSGMQHQSESSEICAEQTVTAETALRLAIASGDEDTIKSLMRKAKCSIQNFQKREDGMLELKVDAKNEEIAFELLSTAHCEMESVKVNGNTALQYAVKTPNLKVLEILIRLGTNLESVRIDGSSVLQYAIKSQNLPVVEAIINAKYQVETEDIEIALLHKINKETSKILHTLLMTGYDASTLRINGKSALEYAIKKGSAEIVKTLITAGCKPESVRIDGSSALQYAIKSQNLPMVKALVNAHCDVVTGDIQIAVENADRKETIKILQILLDTGFDVSTLKINGKSALKYVIKRKRDNVAKRLMKAMYKTFDNDNERTEQFEELIKRGFDVSPADIAKRLALFAAVECGCLWVVNLFIETGYCLSTADTKGRNALHLAVKHSRLDIVKSLLEAGSSVMALDLKGRTALNYAEDSEFIEAFIMLMEAKKGKFRKSSANKSFHQVNAGVAGPSRVQPNVASQKSCGTQKKIIQSNETHNNQQESKSVSDDTRVCIVGDLPTSKCCFLLSNTAGPVSSPKTRNEALLSACALGHSECASELLRARADVNSVDELKRSPLHLAAVNGHAPCVRLLLKARANVHHEAFRMSPLKLALRNGNVECVKLLLQGGALQSETLTTGWQALHVACQSARAECVFLLLQYKAPVEVKATGGWTPLHLAAFAGSVPCVSELLRKGASVDARTSEPNSRTPLQIAVSRGHLLCARLLVTAGASTHAAEGTGHQSFWKLIQQKTVPEKWSCCSKIVLAAHSGHVLCVRSLASGASPSDCCEALLAAAERGHCACVWELLLAGTHVNAADDTGRTALHVAASRDRVQCVLELLMAGAFPNAQTTDTQETPLHLAAKARAERIARNLLDAGARADLLDSTGKPPPIENIPSNTATQGNNVPGKPRKVQRFQNKRPTGKPQKFERLQEKQKSDKKVARRCKDWEND